MSRMDRRQFLKATGTFVASAAMLSKLPACGGDDEASAGTYVFAQGVASGDPRPTSVVLWTRVQRAMGATADKVELSVEVATDADFKNMKVQKMIEAAVANDHTVRVIVTDLTPATAYYYRFTAGSDTIGGRTRTAPDKGADVPVHYAWVSCQDYEAGTYAAWKQLMADDDARADAEKIQFVVHLGDFIYESVGQGFQRAVDENFQPLTVKNADGSDRKVPALPSGQVTARDVGDYRHLYKHYLSDANLRAARARWPFVYTWDDHEFANDCWQSQVNENSDNSLDEPNQQRRVAASQVWFEYLPVQLTGAAGVDGVTSNAKDFTPAMVTNAPFTTPDADNQIPEPNNVAAVGAITIYRSFRFGKHMELALCDERSYRSDHAIPEELTQGRAQFFDPRAVLPIDVVNAFDAGKTANNGSPPAEVLGFPNPRKDTPAGTLLGPKQKAWLKDTLKKSDATWKIWGNPVMLMRLLIKKTGLELLTWDRIQNGDSWDGYPTERREILTYVKNEGIKNVISIAGDIHAHYVGLIEDDPDLPAPMRTTVLPEFTAAGISSNTQLSFFESQTREGVGALLRKVVLFDTSTQKNIENLNMIMMKGTRAAVKYADTGDLQMGLALADDTNAHLKFVDTNAQGYGIMSLTAASASVTLVTIDRPIRSENPAVKRTMKFTVPKDNPAGLTGPEFTGTKPTPFV